MRRKNDKKVFSGSQTDLNANRSSSSTFSGVSDIMSLHGPDPLRKSVSLELLPTATDSDESSHILEGENFQGYLRLVVLPRWSCPNAVKFTSYLINSSTI